MLVNFHLCFSFAASVDDLLFDDEIRIVSEEGEEIDEGRVVASPVPEDFEDLLEDIGEHIEDLPEDKEVFKVIEAVKDSVRVVPIVLEADQEKAKDSVRVVPIVLEADQEKVKDSVRVVPIVLEADQVVPELKEIKKGRGKGDEESSPLPARKKAKAGLLDTEEVLSQLTAESYHEELKHLDEFIHEESSSVVQTSSKTVIQTSVTSEQVEFKSTSSSSTVVGAHESKQVEVENYQTETHASGFVSNEISSTEVKESVITTGQSVVATDIYKQEAELRKKVRETFV